MEDFKQRKHQYITNLKDLLFTERLGLEQYCEELQYDDIDAITNPSNERELNRLNRALEIFTLKCRIKKEGKFDPDTNSAFIANLMSIKSVNNQKYYELAIDFNRRIQSDEYLRGKLIHDTLTLDGESLNEILEYEAGEENLGFLFKFMIAQKMIVLGTGFDELEKFENEHEINNELDLYIEYNSALEYYMKKRSEEEPQEEFVRSFRRKNNI